MPAPRPSPPPSATHWLAPFTGRRLTVLTGAGLLAAFLLARLGLIGEGAASAAVGVLVSVAAALFVIRDALTLRVEAPFRALGLAAAAGLVFATVVPVVTTVLPGAPAFDADLEGVGARAALPGGLAGPVRILVHARLPEGGAPEIRFRLGGTQPPAEGQVERIMSSARIGRGMRAPVPFDHPTTFLDAQLARGAAALTLDRLDGSPQGPLHVAVYPIAFTLGRLWAATAGLLLAAAVLERRGRGHAASAAGMALAFAHLVRGQATPDAPLLTTLGAVALGALLGAVAAALLTWLVGRLVRPVDP